MAPTLSVDALQPRPIWLELMAVAVTLAGTLGVVVSELPLAAVVAEAAAEAPERFPAASRAVTV